MTEAADRERAMKGVQAVFERYKLLADKLPGTPIYDYHCMNNVELLDANLKGEIVYRFKVDQRYGNINGVMHGGAYGVLFDMFTMTALAPNAKPGYWYFMGGLTRSLSISYLKAVPIGTTVLFKSEVIQQGKTMAMIRCRMTSEDGKTVYATCEHHKVNSPTLPDHLKVRIPWDDVMEKEAKEEAAKSKGKSKL